MKSNQVKNGLWKDAVVFFNGFQAKAVDLKLKDLGLKFKLQFLNCLLYTSDAADE